MGSPYLNSGETIVLTTNRVIAEGVSYDVMLTSERIFLIDSRMARLEPRIIPLDSILAVQGGKTPAQEPVITIVFREKREGGRTPPINLLFSQTPNENRKPERDDWVRGLMRLSIHVQEKGREPEKPVVPQATKETGLRPMARHGVAPEMVRPLSNVADHTRPVPVMVIPEEVPGSGEIPLPSQADVREPEVKTAPAEIQEVPATYLLPVRGRPLPASSVPPARVIIPQIIEELLPEKEKTAPVPPEEPVPEPAVIIDQEALFRTIPVSVRPVVLSEEQAPPPVPAAVEIAAEPAPGVAEPGTGPVQETREEKEIPEILKALYTGPLEPEPEEQEEIESGIPETVATENEPEPAGEEVQPEQEPEPAGGDEQPEQVPVHRWSELFPRKTESATEIAVPVPENTGPAGDSLTAARGEPAAPEVSTAYPPGEPAVTPIPEEIRKAEPAAAEGIPVRHPVPPAREIRSGRTTLAYAVGLIILIVLVAAGAMLLSWQGGGPADTTVIVPITTLPPATMPPTTIPPPASETTIPVITQPPVSVPQEGVWVRLTSTAEYYGNIGNTGMMRQVSGSGDTIYPIFWPDHAVLVSVQKKDNTGAVLTATVYRNGTAIGTRSVNSPMGTVEILIDPKTARAPGLSP